MQPARIRNININFTGEQPARIRNINFTGNVFLYGEPQRDASLSDQDPNFGGGRSWRQVRYASSSQPVRQSLFCKLTNAPATQRHKPRSKQRKSQVVKLGDNMLQVFSPPETSGAAAGGQNAKKQVAAGFGPTPVAPPPVAMEIEGPAAADMALSQPSPDLPQPPPDMPQPSLGLPQPSLGLPQPSLGLPQPSLGLPQPSLGLPQPSSEQAPLGGGLFSSLMDMDDMVADDLGTTNLQQNVAPDDDDDVEWEDT
eukprot:gene10665-12350_t